MAFCRTVFFLVALLATGAAQETDINLNDATEIERRLNEIENATDANESSNETGNNDSSNPDDEQPTTTTTEVATTTDAPSDIDRAGETSLFCAVVMTISSIWRSHL